MKILLRHPEVKAEFEAYLQNYLQSNLPEQYTAKAA